MFAMLADTMPVLSVLATYAIAFVQLSLTLYTDLQPGYYDLTINATRWSFDGFLGTYDFNMLMKNEFKSEEMKAGKQDLALSIYNIIVLVNVFIACILMLNFMVAILSESYGTMQTLGSFSFICSQYTYCERYLLAFDDASL